MRILVFLCFAVCSGLCEFSNRECIKSYLDDARLTSVEDGAKCYRIFNKYKTDFTNDIMARLKAEDDQVCILKTFDAYNITELYLKGLSQHLHNVNANQTAYNQDVSESKDAFLNAAKVLCTADNKYSDDFNEYFTTSQRQKNNSETSHVELCTKKYFIDKKIIDPTEYNIDTSTLHPINCAATFKDLEENFSIEDEDEKANTFFGLSAVKAQNCATERFAQEKVFQNLFAFQILVNLELSEEKISHLRSTYIKWMTSSVRFLLECVKEI